ncbi:MAG: hypothetical protein WCJ33_04420 [Pseudomonadota bacterium]
MGKLCRFAFKSVSESLPKVATLRREASVKQSLDCELVLLPGIIFQVARSPIMPTL